MWAFSIEYLLLYRSLSLLCLSRHPVDNPEYSSLSAVGLYPLIAFLATPRSSDIPEKYLGPRRRRKIGGISDVRLLCIS
ncbi:uncharacterized protein P174DRAFT_442394 [Aspergillus novofumigatus IBT 16806]|uniref:Uncharacterized protein n=1 Tax=Aspergillus novofumigatus (strain IBT 16806) TaxID=1392255 RepID=A0A2I1C4J4_ASPN1|nr:uncharacterized protein P174DRAFT_442394 [Aspergillus novofumigatus IBT 16806]PKX92547.1 hypothetical protein P174DRAFT_442394 [Aspergillus novofumigatus IBT 16806]